MTMCYNRGHHICLPSISQKEFHVNSMDSMLTTSRQRQFFNFTQVHELLILRDVPQDRHQRNKIQMVSFGCSGNSDAPL